MMKGKNRFLRLGMLVACAGFLPGCEQHQCGENENLEIGLYLGEITCDDICSLAEGATVEMSWGVVTTRNNCEYDHYELLMRNGLCESCAVEQSCLDNEPEGTAPRISNLSIGLFEDAWDQQYYRIRVDFEDDDGDIWLMNGSIGEMQLATDSSNEVCGEMVGTFSGRATPDDMTVPLDVEVWLTDERGHTSNHLEGVAQP